MRTNKQIIDQTNALARALCKLRGYDVPEGHKFELAHNPKEIEAWYMACEAQIILKNTDPNECLK